MKAAVYETFRGPIRVKHLDMPICPPDGVIIRVQACGVCRSDLHAWLGHDGAVRNHGLPFVPGHEFAGIVHESNVDTLRVEDRVVCPFILSCGSCENCRHGRNTICAKQQQPGFTLLGSMAEFCAIPRATGHVVVLPPQVSFVQAAALGCRLTTAYRALVQQAQLRSDQSVAVFGCGGVGLSCVMIARALLGQKVGPIVAVDVSLEALALAQSLGATHTILVDKNTMVTKELRRICPKGCHVCVDAAGFAATSAQAVQCTRPGGRMVQVGLITGDKPRVDMSYVAGKEIVIVGSHGFAAVDLPHLLELVALGRLQPERLVQRQVSLVEGCYSLMKMKDSSPLGITVVTDFSSDDDDSIGIERRVNGKL